MRKTRLPLILAAILTAALTPARASLQEEKAKWDDYAQHRQFLIEPESTAADIVSNVPPVGGGRVETEEGGRKMSLRESIERIEEYDRHRQFLIAQSERSAGVSPDETDNPFIRESVDRMFREQTEEERMAEQRRRERKEITGGLIVIALSIGYLLWIQRLLKSKTAKSVPREIFRDAATVAGLLLALALLSEMVYGSSGFRAAHFRSAMFIAVSSAALPYLCMMYLADGYRRPYLWRAKILYPQTAAMLAYWLMLYAADIADGEGSGNVMASLFGLFLSSVFCVALKIKLGRSQSQ